MTPTIGFRRSIVLPTLLALGQNVSACINGEEEKIWLTETRSVRSGRDGRRGISDPLFPIKSSYRLIA